MAISFDKIKGLFVVDGASPTPTEEKDTTEEKKISSNQAKTTPVSGMPNSKLGSSNIGSSNLGSTNKTISSPSMGGVFNEKIYEQLMKAIYDANLPGEDYIEFIEALDAMKNLPLDELIKMQTVMATLSTKGLTKEKVLHSAEHYLKVLETEKGKFDQALKGQNSQLQQRNSEISSLEKENIAKAEQIKLLTEEISKNQQEVLRIKNEMAEAEAKVKATINNFEFTYQKVAEQIVKNVEKITTL